MIYRERNDTYDEYTGMAGKVPFLTLLVQK
jgi:hypothetical protein